jgi:hypothetical protein
VLRASPDSASAQEDVMALIPLIVTLVVIGLLLWAVESVIPMDPTIKNIIRVIVIVVVCLWLLSLFGLLPGRTIHVS